MKKRLRQKKKVVLAVEPLTLRPPSSRQGGLIQDALDTWEPPTARLGVCPRCGQPFPGMSQVETP